jgi:uncharacterized membrane protein YhaH (DUF805 family)
MQESPIRRGVATAALAVLLAGPTVLAFFAGGFFDVPRAWAGIIAWALVLVAALVVPHPLPRDRAALISLVGLALFAGWTLASTIWAPIKGDAYQAGVRVFVYLGALTAACALLRAPSARRLVEPALAAGILIVIGYGISERLLPGLLHFHRSLSAEGRLEQPLTYWNAMGELAAIGVVLAARITGDTRRPWALRAAALAACAPLGLGLYLSFSRGALFACAAGLITLVVALPERAQVRAALVALVTVVLSAIASAPFAGVTGLSGSLSTREGQGAGVLVALVVIAIAAVLVGRRLLQPDPPGAIRLPRHASLLTLLVVCAGLAVAIVAGAHEASGRPLAGGATRLTSFESNRYDYWRVALHAFGQQPLRGVGAGGWAVEWLQRRPYGVGAEDAHSLPLQTAAELGIIGLVLLALFLGGLVVAARRAHRISAAMAAGPLAAFVAYIAHSPLDWDWEMPALTLVAIILAGALLIGADDAPAAAVASVPESAREAEWSATVSHSHASARTSGAEGAGAGSHRD